MTAKTIQRFPSILKSLLLFPRYAGERSEKARKTIFLDIRTNPYNRFLYLFVKFFHLEGYNVVLRKNLRLFHQIRSDRYASLLLQERIVTFGRRRKNYDLTFNGKQLSADYFSGLYRNEPDALITPITQHPLMYHHGWWNNELPPIPRKRSVFMVSNMSPQEYERIEESGIFPVVSRHKIYKNLEQKGLLHDIDSIAMLKEYLESSDEGHIILLDRTKVNVPMELLRYLLSHFEFSFALPGIIMPFSHHLTEAMSVGTIPLIQTDYARLVRPSLQHEKEVIVFNDENDLEANLRHMLEMPASKIEAMRAQVLHYYQEFLTPAALVRQIESGQYRKIYLQAEFFSQELFLRNGYRSFTKQNETPVQSGLH